MIKMHFANTESNYKTIEDLAKTIWTEHYTPIIGAEQVVYMLDNFQTTPAIKNQIDTGAKYYLVINNETAVGYCSFYKKENALFLSKIYVLKSERGKGIGSYIMDFVSNQAENNKLSIISLTVNKNNKASIKSYEKMGFKIKKAIKMDIGNGFFMDDYVMEKTLN